MTWIHYGVAIAWRSDFSLGIDGLDKQHQELFALLAEIERHSAEDRQSLLRIIKRLFDYTQYHFAAEEGLLLKLSYPQSDEHRDAHREFTQTVRGLFEKAKAGEAVNPAEIAGQIGRWIESHIAGADHGYASYFRENGINISDNYFFDADPGSDEATVEAAQAMWNDRGLELRVKEIDGQHRALVMILQQASDLNQRGVSEPRRHLHLPVIIRKLYYYTQFHFHAEEQLMEKHNYPAIEEHSTQHRYFIGQVAKFARDFKAKRTTLSDDIVRFLRDWTMDHIVQVDGQFRDHIRDTQDKVPAQ